LLRALEKMGMTDTARRLRIAQAWAEAVGPEVAARTQPQGFRRGVLVIKSASAAWQNELTFMKADLMERLNRALGSNTVRDLKVISGTIAEKKPEPPPVWVGELPSAEDLDVARDASQPIKDAQLSSAFEDLLLIDRRARRSRNDE
jgi:hypothetical protein